LTLAYVTKLLFDNRLSGKIGLRCSVIIVVYYTAVLLLLINEFLFYRHVELSEAPSAIHCCIVRTPSRAFCFFLLSLDIGPNLDRQFFIAIAERKLMFDRRQIDSLRNYSE